MTVPVLQVGILIWMYRSLTLVLGFREGSCESPQNKISSFLTLHIVPHTPKASSICEIFFFVKSLSEKWKIHEKVVTHLVDFIGFMVCKTTSSISQSFLLKKIAKQAQLGVPHSRIQVELGFILQAWTCQILNFA